MNNLGAAALNIIYLCPPPPKDFPLTPPPPTHTHRILAFVIDWLLRSHKRKPNCKIKNKIIYSGSSLMSGGACPVQ